MFSSLEFAPFSGDANISGIFFFLSSYFKNEINTRQSFKAHLPLNNSFNWSLTFVWRSIDLRYKKKSSLLPYRFFARFSRVLKIFGASSQLKLFKQMRFMRSDAFLAFFCAFWLFKKRKGKKNEILVRSKFPWGIKKKKKKTHEIKITA